MVLGQLAKEWNWTPTSYHIHEPDSKQINGPDMKSENIKFLEEPNDFGFGDRFLDMAPKHKQQMKK